MDPLVFSRNGVEYMRLAVDLTVYWAGSSVHHADGIGRFYARALECLEGRLRHYETAQMTGPLPIDGNALALVPHWTRQPEEEQEFRSLKLEAGELPPLPSDTALGFWSVPFKQSRVGALKLVLPAETAAWHMMSLAVELVSQLGFSSGHMGYSVNWDHRGKYAPLCRRTMGWLARRFPGIDLPDIHCALMAVPFGIKRINWLTLLGETLAGELGGIDGLTERFADPGIGVQVLPHGVLIAAGRSPGVGDVNRNDQLPLYHAVGRALAAIRSRQHPPFLSSAREPIDDELSAEWLAHFDT
jgi:hypothetical protein